MTRRYLHVGDGFTLLEAIVALALMATAGIALYGLITSNLTSFQRVQTHSSRVRATHNALEWMKQVNPAATAKGVEESNGLRIEWNSTPLAPMVEGHGYPGPFSLFQVGLFETQVTVVRDGNEVARFVLRQVGYRQVRQARPTVF